MSSKSELPFVKYHGAGNDYVLVDAVDSDADWPDRLPALAAPFSDRRFGVGSDGLIVVTREESWRMHMWNADGSRGAICGNGLRCVASMLRDHEHENGVMFRIRSDVAWHDVEIRAGSFGDRVVAIDMGRAVAAPQAASLEVDGSRWSFVAADVGNPHAVVFLDSDLEALDVDTVGRAFQADARFPDGVNVEFVRRIGDARLRQRTYERGSGETLACGSGATAVVAAARAHGVLPGNGPVAVELRGGVLTITHRGDDLYELAGPAKRVFAGTIPL